VARLAGRKIIITGGASGHRARNGAAVQTRGRGGRDPRTAPTTPPRPSPRRSAAVAFGCDVADPASVAAAVSQAAQAMGGLDGVVNAAGILAGNRHRRHDGRGLRPHRRGEPDRHLSGVIQAASR